MKKIEMDGKLCSVTTLDEYTRNLDLYNPRSTAIEMADGTVLPIRNCTTDTGPGIYYRQGYATCEVVDPSPERAAYYRSDRIIDFSKPHDIGEVMNNAELLRSIRDNLMISGADNILMLTITNDDTPEMKALKTAINAKQIDKRQYQDRFNQYQNDMRILRGHSVTLGKLIGICNSFDIDVELTLRDKNDGFIPNPMGDDITISLTEGRPVKG